MTVRALITGRRPLAADPAAAAPVAAGAGSGVAGAGSRVGGGGRGVGGGGRASRGRWDDGVALTADLLAVAVAAGLTPYLALEVAVRFGPEPVAGRLATALAGLGGGRLADALDDEALRTPALAPFLALLAASERSGAPVGAALARVAASTRAQARRRAMARARTVPVRLLFPLVFLVLPAFLLLTVAPVVLAAVSH